MSLTAPRSGLWPSEITASEANSGVASPQYPERVRGQLTWVEARPKEGGRNVLMIEESDGSHRTLTPDGFNVRTRVYEYGGRSHAFFLDSGDWHVAFVNFSDQAVYVQPLDGGGIRRLTTEAYGTWRFADLQPLPAGQGLIAVAEVHDGGPEPRDLLVHLSLDASSVVTTLHEEPDFVAMPAVAADGSGLAWVQWNHPNMQWDYSELWTAVPSKIAAGYPPPLPR